MEQMRQLEEELSNTKIEGTAGGMVKVEATGAGAFGSVTIDPQAVAPDDVEMLQDLVLSAFRDAAEKASKLREERVKSLMPAGISDLGGLGGLGGGGPAGSLGPRKPNPRPPSLRGGASRPIER